MSKERVLVTIPENKMIPMIGRGPVRSPISITTYQYETLVKIGFNVKLVDESKLLTKAEKVVTESEPVVEEVETIEDEIVEEPEAVLDTVEEDLTEVEVVEDESYSEEDLTEATKAELKELLDKRDVKYIHNANLKELKKLVLESNPS